MNAIKTDITQIRKMITEQKLGMGLKSLTEEEVMNNTDKVLFTSENNGFAIIDNSLYKVKVEGDLIEIAGHVFQKKDIEFVF